MMPENRIYGWKPSLPDPRDEVWPTRTEAVPARYDPRADLPPVYDQGQLGSCTANAVAGALQIHWKVDWVPSRLFIYYFERKVEHNLGHGDTGAYGRDGFKIARKHGVPPEKAWPYDISHFEDKPPRATILLAHSTTLEERFKKVPLDRATMRSILARGLTIAFGFSVYESFESAQVARTGVVPMPDTSREKLLGGHEVLAVGYTPDAVIVRNSWGEGWGDGGYGYFPWALVAGRLADDHRTIAKH